MIKGKMKMSKMKMSQKKIAKMKIAKMKIAKMKIAKMLLLKKNSQVVLLLWIIKHINGFWIKKNK